MDDIRHKVKQGECIRTIAAAYGFAKCRPIIEYEKNSRLREKRPDMNCLLPGDEVFIPPKKGTPVPADGRSRVKIIVSLPVFRFTLTLKAPDGNVISDARYTLKIGSEEFKGRTDPNGLISHLFKEKSEYADLELYLDEQNPNAVRHLQLNISHLDPVETGSGLQARLKNLGYYSGKIDGDKGPVTENAIRQFQENQGIPATGDICSRTMDALNGIYG